MTQIAYPWQIDLRGRTATTDEDRHIRDLIEQVLLTAPGERVNRPGFGTGLARLLFAPLSEELAATTQFLIQSALQQWLGDLIEVRQLAIDAVDSSLTVTITYLVRRSQSEQVLTITRSG